MDMRFIWEALKNAESWAIHQTSLEEPLVFEALNAPHSSTLAWKIPWTGEPGGLQSMGSLRAETYILFSFPASEVPRGKLKVS